MNTSYISNIAYYKGKQFPLSTIEGADEEQVELLQTTGIKNYCATELELEEMCAQVAGNCLSKFSGNRKEIGPVVFSTTSDTISSCGFDYKKVDKILHENELENAYVYGSFLSTCSNLSTSLQVANALLSTSEYEHALVVVGDKFRKDEQRFMKSNESILSDGAAALILSKSSGEFQLQHLSVRNDLEHLTKNFNVLEFLKNATENLKDLWREINEKFDSNEVEKVFFGNYNLLAQRGFRGQLQLKKDQLFMDNISEVGHLFSIDVLVNLLDYLKNRTETKSNLFACFTTGYFRWGTFLIQKL